jgi:hypothetical protein
LGEISIFKGFHNADQQVLIITHIVAISNNFESKEISCQQHTIQ